LKSFSRLAVFCALFGLVCLSVVLSGCVYSDKAVFPSVSPTVGVPPPEVPSVSPTVGVPPPEVPSVSPDELGMPPLPPQDGGG